MAPTGLIFFISFGMLIVVAAIIIIMMRRIKVKTKNYFKVIAAKYNLDGVEISPSGSEMNCVHQKRSFSCVYFPGSKNAPASMTVTLDSPAPVKLIIKKEGAVERFAKNIGLTEELQTHDPFFDKDFFLDTESPLLYENYFSSDSKRQAVKDIFAAGQAALKITYDKSGISVVVAPFDIEKSSNFDVRVFFDKLLTLAANLPDVIHAGYQEQSGQRQQVDKVRVGVLAAVVAVSFLGGLFLLISGMRQYEHLRCSYLLNSFLYSVPALAMFLYVSYHLLKGSSSSHIYFIAISIFGAASFVLAGLGGVIFTNGYLDESTPVRHEFKIAERYCTKNKNSYNYYITFPSWTHPGENEEVKVRRNFYDSVDVGEECEIVTKSGHWEQEWIIRGSLRKRNQ